MSLMDLLFYIGIAMGAGSFGALALALCVVAKNCPHESDDFTGDQS